MSDPLGEFLIQISIPAPAPHVHATAYEADRHPVCELTQYLHPGAEIALLFDGFALMTSILWLSNPRSDGSLSARVRILGLSARPPQTTANKEAQTLTSERFDAVMTAPGA